MAYTYEQVMDALRNADAAGDVESARQLADLAYSMQQQPAEKKDGASFLQKAINPYVQAVKGLTQFNQNVPESVREAAGAVVDPAATMALGTAGYAASNVAGLGAIPAHAMGLTDKEPKQVKEDVQSVFNYQPQTSIGSYTTKPLEWIGQGIDYVATKATEGIDDPIVKAGAKETVINAPALFGARKIGDLRGKGARESKIYAERDAIREAGQAEGLIAPPESGFAKKFLYHAGRAKDAISMRNQQSATSLLAKDVDLPSGVPITRDMIAERRIQLNKQYDAVSEAMPKGIATTTSFENKVRTLASDLSKKVDESPKLYESLKPVADIVKELEAKLQSTTVNGKRIGVALDAQSVMDDIGFLREKASQAYNAGDKKIGNYYKKLANEYEALVADNLKNTNNFKVYNEFEAARTKHAKLHFMDEVLGENGLVDFNAMRSKAGRTQEKARFMTGGAKVAADFANEFPTATRSMKADQMQGAGKWEVTVPLIAGAETLAAGGGIMGAATGNPAALAAALPLAISYTAPILGARGMLQAAPDYTYAGRKGFLATTGAAPQAEQTRQSGAGREYDWIDQYLKSRGQ